jgi:hypothetical protein
MRPRPEEVLVLADAICVKQQKPTRREGRNRSIGVNLRGKQLRKKVNIGIFIAAFS